MVDAVLGYLTEPGPEGLGATGGKLGPQNWPSRQNARTPDAPLSMAFFSSVSAYMPPCDPCVTSVKPAFKLSVALCIACCC